MNRVSVIIFVMVMGLTAVLPSYCQAAAVREDMKTLEGEVVTVDDVGQTLEIMWLRDAEEGAYDNVTFSVSKMATITRGIEDIDLEDLDMAERVVVDYYKDSFGALIATRITVKEE